MHRWILVLSIASASPTATVFAQTVKDVQLVQEKLTSYRAGEVDGVFSRGTSTAIQEYQRDWGILETGRITPNLIAMLKRKHEWTKPQWFRVANLNCAIWNPGPEPKATVTWSGLCELGRTSGTGKVIWTFYRYRQSHQFIYEGERSDGKAHGKGVFLWSDGSRYDGGWINDRRQGRGRMDWASGELAGARYSGGWKNDKPDGLGTLVTVEGKFEKRLWRKGCSSLNGQTRAIGTTMKACGFASPR